jgi:hypothetical protein
MVFKKKYCVLLGIVLLQVPIIEGAEKEKRSWLATRLTRTSKVSKTEKKTGCENLTQDEISEMHKTKIIKLLDKKDRNDKKNDSKCLKKEVADYYRSRQIMWGKEEGHQKELEDTKLYRRVANTIIYRYGQDPEEEWFAKDMLKALNKTVSGVLIGGETRSNENEDTLPIYVLLKLNNKLAKEVHDRSEVITDSPWETYSYSIFKKYPLPIVQKCALLAAYCGSYTLCKDLFNICIKKSAESKDFVNTLYLTALHAKRTGMLVLLNDMVDELNDSELSTKCDFEIYENGEELAVTLGGGFDLLVKADTEDYIQHAAREQAYLQQLKNSSEPASCGVSNESNVELKTVVQKTAALYAGIAGYIAQRWLAAKTSKDEFMSRNPRPVICTGVHFCDCIVCHQGMPSYIKGCPNAECRLARQICRHCYLYKSDAAKKIYSDALQKMEKPCTACQGFKLLDLSYLFSLAQKQFSALIKESEKVKTLIKTEEKP